MGFSTIKSVEVVLGKLPKCMSLNDIIDFILNCMYVNIRKGMLLSRTNFVMMSNIMLMFLLL